MKLDYISILAGGSCSFGCDFCVGNDIRNKITPHYSRKLDSFIECFSDMTDLISVSGDTSDPSLIGMTWAIPQKIRIFNKHMKITLHTRDKYIGIKAINHGYDKYVLSIDELFLDALTDSMIVDYRFLSDNKKMRLSIVLTKQNYQSFYGSNNLIDKIMKLFPSIQITLRPNVFEQLDLKKLKSFFGEWSILNNGAEVLTSSFNDTVWLWDYRKTNSRLEVRYLFSDGAISSNCGWDRLIN